MEKIIMANAWGYRRWMLQDLTSFSLWRINGTEVIWNRLIYKLPNINISFLSCSIPDIHPKEKNLVDSQVEIGSQTLNSSE